MNICCYFANDFWRFYKNVCIIELRAIVQEKCFVDRFGDVFGEKVSLHCLPTSLLSLCSYLLLLFFIFIVYIFKKQCQLKPETKQIAFLSTNFARYCLNTIYPQKMKLFTLKLVNTWVENLNYCQFVKLLHFVKNLLNYLDFFNKFVKLY